MRGRRAKTMANEKRESASGITPSRGMGRVTVGKEEGTPSIHVDGTAASRIHLERRRQLIGRSALDSSTRWSIGGVGPSERDQATAARHSTESTRKAM